MLLVAPNTEIIRDLMTISKVLQTVANGVFFTKKEAHLVELNDFVEEYQGQLLQLFDELAAEVCPFRCPIPREYRYSHHKKGWGGLSTTKVTLRRQIGTSACGSISSGQGVYCLDQE